MIDSHTHLDMVPGTPAEAVAEATAQGVTRMLSVGVTRERCELTLQLAQEHEAVFAAVGLHPNNAEDFDEDRDGEWIRELGKHAHAIGETGLDFYRDRAPRAKQEAAFRTHIAIARELDKPLVIHTRDADDATLDLLAREGDGVRTILHCFSMPGRLDEALERGYWISFAGNVTYPRNEELAQAAAKTPLDRLLVETDAPYLTPQAVRKERNQPAFVVHTARFVAEQRGIAYEELEQAVERTASELLRW